MEEEYREIARMDLEKERYEQCAREEMEENERIFWNQQKGEYHEIRN